MNAGFAGRILAGLLVATAAASAQPQSEQKPGLSEQDVAASSAATPAAPARPAELPPKPATVTCSEGQMTVVGENSTMGSILTAVQSCIHVRFEIPAETRDQRTFVRLGPGSPSSILRSLLESTDDDFVIQPSASNQETIAAVILMAPAKKDDVGNSPNRSLTAARRAWIDQRRETRTPAQETEDDAGQLEDSAAESQAAADASTAEAAASTAPSEVSGSAGTQTAKADASAGPAAAPATDASNGSNEAQAKGQLQNQITDMQQMFQQRQAIVATQTKPPQSASTQSPQ